MQRAALGQDTSSRPGHPIGRDGVRARQVRPFHCAARLLPTAMQLDGPAQSTALRSPAGSRWLGSASGGRSIPRSGRDRPSRSRPYSRRRCTGWLPGTRHRSRKEHEDTRRGDRHRPPPPAVPYRRGGWHALQQLDSVDHGQRIRLLPRAADRLGCRPSGRAPRGAQRLPGCTEDSARRIFGRSG